VPTLANPVSQLCTQSQFEEPIYAEWCTRMNEVARYHRKQWEHVYIAQVLQTAGMLQPGKRGLGFGVGLEPLPALFASYGCDVLVTDLPGGENTAWADTGQYAGAKGWLLRTASIQRGLVTERQYDQHVEHRLVDMRYLPVDLRAGEFDFVWSACSLDHLGSLDYGLAFIRSSLDCLRPGGVAVHTTEYNLSSIHGTLAYGDVVLYRAQELTALLWEMRRAGYLVDMDLRSGKGEMDRQVALSAEDYPHLRYQIDRYVTTSVGIVIQKPEGESHDARGSQRRTGEPLTA
jgi:SAM-dependent methyltransferase